MRVALATYWVTEHPQASGHFWVYAQYADALRRIGCDVWWLEEMSQKVQPEGVRHGADLLTEQLRPFGLADKVILYQWQPGADKERTGPSYLNIAANRAEQVLGDCDLLLNFHYTLPASMLARFRRTALVDIDPGLLQLWWRNRQLQVSPHDLYFSIGENLGDVPGADHARWTHTCPAVSLDLWPYSYEPASSRFTTVTSWESQAYVMMDGLIFDSTKRAAYQPFLDLPGRVEQHLELATALGPDEIADRRSLESHGWVVRDAAAVAGDPNAYRSYIQSSRGEFGLAKPAYVMLRNAWFSDRTACYLASGKPAVVQDTGPSSYLPDGLGLMRFSSAEEAIDALAEVETHYERHCRAAREIAEAHFCATEVVARMLDRALAN